MTNSHPLDPLSADEIRQAAAILRRDRKIGDTWRFASIELKEPAKDALAAGEQKAREAIVVCWDRADGQARRATVSLTGDKVTHWEDLPGQQPNMTVDEWHECDEMLRAHPAVAEALARRGVTDMSLVLTDMWAYGAALVPERYKNRRIGWSDVWYRDSELGNPYAHHVTGLHPVVDLNTMTLLELEDNYEEGAGADPEVMGEYLPRLIPTPLREVTPLEITQPDGVGFTLDGHLLSWQNWQLRLGFNHREGLVLHQVGFRDGERLRSVAHRLSFAEMVVPYRDASPDHYRRTAFDIGEWGLGFMTTSLALGCDCLGEITYLDAVVHDSRGEPRTIPNAICIHEEDSGVAVEARGRAGRRRGPAGPAAGDLLPRHRGQLRVPGVLAVLPGRQHRVRGPRDRDHGHLAHRRAGQPARPTGRWSTSGTYAPFHQHFIVARLDLDVDGPDNTVYVTESRAGSGRATPTTRTGWAWWSGAPRCAPRPRGSRTTTGPRSAAGRS